MNTIQAMHRTQARSWAALGGLGLLALGGCAAVESRPPHYRCLFGTYTTPNGEQEFHGIQCAPYWPDESSPPRAPSDSSASAP